MNDHFLKDWFKNFTTDELRASLLTASVFDFPTAIKSIEAELKRREQENDHN